MPSQGPNIPEGGETLVEKGPIFERADMSPGQR